MLRNNLIGIVIIGWVLILAAFPATMVAFIAMVSSGPLALHIRFPLFLSPILLGASGIGVLLQKQWARLFAIVVSLITTAYLFYIAKESVQILSDHPEWTSSNTSFAVTLTVIAILFLSIACYLIRPQVKGYFKK